MTYSRPHWSPEMKAAFAEAWNAETSLEEMAAKFGFKHTASVSKRAARLGLIRRNGVPYEPWSEEDDAALRQMWNDPDFLLTANMAKRFNRNRDDIRCRAEQLGLPPQPKRLSLYKDMPYRLTKAPWVWTPERNEFLRWAWVEYGATYDEIAHDLGTSKNSVWKQRARLGLPGVAERDAANNLPQT